MLDAKSQTAISMNLGDQRRRAVAASGIQDPKNMLASSTLTESII